MTETISPFLDESFQSAVQKCCAHAGWPIDRMEEGMAVLEIADLSQDNPQIVFIEDYSSNTDSSLENHLKISLTTGLVYDQGVAPPYELLIELLQNNDIDNEVGYWCLEYRKGSAAVSLRHFENKKDMTEAQFQKIIIHLMMRCDLFESEHMNGE